MARQRLVTAKIVLRDDVQPARLIALDSMPSTRVCVIQILIA